jgi:hypothetical protein
MKLLLSEAALKRGCAACDSDAKVLGIVLRSPDLLARLVALKREVEEARRLHGDAAAEALRKEGEDQIACCVVLRECVREARREAERQ